MATKKTASSVKKSTVKRTSPKTTKVTTVKAVSADKPADKLFGLKMYRSPLLGAGLAEFIGTFLLAAVVIVGSANGQQIQPIPAFFGLAAIVFMISAMSGAHINPAVTVAAWATRKISGVRALVYVVAQVLGAMLALVVLNAFVHNAPEVSQQAAMFGQTTPELFKAAAIPADKEWVVFFAELLGATIFGFAMASVVKTADRVTAAFTAGLGYFLALMVAGTAAVWVAGSAILNPALAVALQAVDFKTIWPFAVYIFAAALGAMIGFILNDLLSVESSRRD
jgi:glycerol uptake facilitator-like aquaporin